MASVGKASGDGLTKAADVPWWERWTQGVKQPRPDAQSSLPTSAPETEALAEKALADGALTRLGVDHLGLDGADRRYLALIAEAYQGGPVGIETMSAALSESRDALEEVIEPFLLQQGLIQRTPRGRMLAQRGWRHLGLEAPGPNGQNDLFGK